MGGDAARDDDWRRVLGRQLVRLSIADNRVVLPHKHERRDMVERTLCVHGLHDALVCCGEIAAEHERHLEGGGWRVRQINAGERRALRVAKDPVEGSLILYDSVQRIDGVDCPVWVGRWTALPTRRVTHPQPTRGSTVFSCAAVGALREN
eukprot:2771524-Prymnesium_polylepis.1